MAYFSVTTAAPSGPGSLSDAVAQANLTPGDDDIGFAPALNGATITLGGALEVTQGIVRIFGDIDGDRVGDITISGDTNASGAPDAGDAKFFVTRGEGQVELDSLTLTGGYDGPGGTVGVLANEGRRMVITNSVVKDSVSVADDISYDIYASNAATISNFGQELVIFDTLLQGNLSFAGSGVNSDGPNNVAGILTGAGVLSIDGVGFGVEAIGGQGAPGYDGGDGVVGILITGGSIQGDGGDPRLGLATNAGAFPGAAGAGGAPGVAVLGLAEARGGFDYVIDTPIFGLSGDIAPNTIDRSGETENQILLGFAGADTLRGGAGDDQIFGGQDDDVLSGGGGENLVDGGQGFDTAVLGGAFADFTATPVANGVILSNGVERTQFSDVEQFFFTDATLSLSAVQGLATEGDDFLLGAETADSIAGLGGNDSILGRGGDDTLSGGGGDDTLDGGAGVNLIDGGAGVDLVRFAEARSAFDVSVSGVAIRLVSATTSTTVTNAEFFEFAGARLALSQVVPPVETGATEGPDDLRLTGRPDLLFALGGDDTVDGRGGGDSISGGDGDDSLFGRGGADALTGEAGDDTLDGGGGGDVLSGGANRDLLIGGGGKDDLDGGAGRDTLDGGGGGDTLSGGAGGRDQLDGGGGRDSLDGGRGGRDQLAGGGGKDTLDGGAGRRDVMDGGGGKDTLFGGAGSGDTLIGGAGDDVFAFSTGDGDDVIADFRQGADTILIDEGATVFTQLDIDQIGDDVRITFSDVSITVLNQRAGDFAFEDFDGVERGPRSRSDLPGGSSRDGLAPDRDADFGAQAGGGEDALF